MHELLASIVDRNSSTAAPIHQVIAARSVSPRRRRRACTHVHRRRQSRHEADVFPIKAYLTQTSWSQYTFSGSSTAKRLGFVMSTCQIHSWIYTLNIRQSHCLMMENLQLEVLCDQGYQLVQCVHRVNMILGYLILWQGTLQIITASSKHCINQEHCIRSHQPWGNHKDAKSSSFIIFTVID